MASICIYLLFFDLKLCVKQTELVFDIRFRTEKEFKNLLRICSNACQIDPY